MYKNMSALALTLLACHCMAGPTPEWRQNSYVLVSGPVDETVVSVRNLGPLPLTVPADSGSNSKPQTVSGASTNDPAWDSKFNPLVSNTVTHNWSHCNYVLGPGYGLVVKVIWHREVGNQGFDYYEDGVFAGLTASRNRDWHSNPVTNLYLTYPEGDDEEGGEGGG